MHPKFTSSSIFTCSRGTIYRYNQWDIEAILAPRAEDCKQRVFPARLDRPWLNNTEYREFMTKDIMTAFKGFKVEVLEVVEDPKRHKIVLHARSKGESVIGDYANEYMIMMQMTEDVSGPQIESLGA